MPPRLDTFLRVAADQKASDLHFHAGKMPTVRYQGELVPLPFRVLSEDEARHMLMEFLTEPQKDLLDRESELDFAYELAGVGRYRVHVYSQSAGFGAVFRVIPTRIPTFADLRLPPVVGHLARQARGLVLVTGPTGCGKSTTMAAMINEVNRTSRRHIITIEDPVEYVHEPLQSVITQREVGRHTEGFASALRSALRETPDVLAIGEMRDYETISLALSAAEAGVLVIGTLHTNSAAKAIDRLVGACPEDVQEQARGILSVLLRGVVAQRLCRLMTGEGRIAAVEVLLQSYSVAHLIRENKIHQIQTYLKAGDPQMTGMRSLEVALLSLVRERLITREEARRHANDRSAFEELPASVPPS